MLSKCYKQVGKKHQGTIFITSIHQVQVSVNKMLRKWYKHVGKKHQGNMFITSI